MDIIQAKSLKLEKTERKQRKTKIREEIKKKFTVSTGHNLKVHNYWLQFCPFVCVAVKGTYKAREKRHKREREGKFKLSRVLVKVDEKKIIRIKRCNKGKLKYN